MRERNGFRMPWEHSSLLIVAQGAFLSMSASVAGRRRVVDLWRATVIRADEPVDRLEQFAVVDEQVRRARVVPPPFVTGWAVLPAIRLRP